MAFKITSSPHVHRNLQTATVMQRVILCALPGLIAQSVFFGWGNIIQVAIAILVAVAAEAAIMKLRNRSISYAISDYSAVLTALLLGIAIPPMAPWWLIVVGTLFAIVIVKQLYGGLGSNLFNPAMAGYVLLLIAYPVQMTSWIAPATIAQHLPSFWDSLQQIFESSTVDMSYYRLAVDGTTMATPLDTLRTSLSMGLSANDILSKPIFDGSTGIGWFWVNIGYLIGGLIMLKMKLIRWQIPIAILCALFVCSGIGYLMAPATHASPVFHLFSGATMLAAFFIATDPVTAATSNKGRLLFGAIIGVLIYVIRTFGGYPDAVAFAVLLANLCAPLIDYYIKPRTYGHRTSHN